MSKKIKSENPDEKYKMHPLAASLVKKDQEGSGDMLPRKEINWDKVETAMMFGASLNECAAVGGVHYNTLERRILERYGDTFRVVRDAMMSDQKIALRQRLYKAAKNGSVPALIFLNRAVNKMNDRLREGDEDDDGDSTTFHLAYDPKKAPPPPSIPADFTKKD